MPLINRSPDDEAFIKTFTNINKNNEYDQSTFTSALTTFNSLASLSLRGKYASAEADVKKYTGEFNWNNIPKQLQEQKVPQSVIDEVMKTPSMNNWEDVERRKNFITEVQERQKQLSENLNTPELLALGLTLGVADIDSLAINPVLSLTSKATKTLGLASKSAKILSYVGTGAYAGATSTLVNEATTGVYKKNSLVESAFVGGALGGSLGYFLTRSVNNPNLIVTKDNATNKVLSKEKAIAQEVAKHEDRLEDINYVINRYEQSQKDARATSSFVEASIKNDRAENRLTTFNMKKAMENIVSEYKNQVKDLETNLKPLRSEVDTLQKSLREAFSNRQSFDKQRLEYQVAKKKIAELSEDLASAEASHEALSSHLDMLNAQSKPRPTRSIRKVERDLDKKQVEIASINARLDTVNYSISNFEKNAPEDASILDKNISEIKETLSTKQKALEPLESELNAKQLKLTNTKFTLSNLKGRRKSKYIFPSEDTLRLKKINEDQQKLLNPDGLRSLIQERDSVAESLSKLADGDLTSSNLYSLRRERQNAVEKLHKELESIGTLRDFRQSDSFKKLPEWARKIMISPIEKLLNHPDDLVSGFASLLHSGTVHHGKVDNHTAWNIRQKLDGRVNRLHKSILFEYKDAVKNGYRGKFHDFQSDISSEARSVIGDLQRQMVEGIPADITGDARASKIKENAVGISRNYSTSNKHVKKAVDDLLDYYEGIHAYGKKLNMEVFKNSVGKGYLKRVYSKDKITEMGETEAISLLVEAQESYARANGFIINQEIIDGYKAKANAVVQSAMNGELRKFQLTDSLGARQQTTTSSFRERTIEAFDDDLDAVLSDDINGTTMVYGLNTHGSLALKEKLGVDSVDQIEDMFQQMNLKGKDLDNMRVVVQTILGNREINKNPYSPMSRITKALSSYTSAMHTLAFAVPTITEISSVAKEFGWGKTIKGFMGTPKEVYNIYRTGTPSEKNTINMMISYGDAHFNNKANRFDVESTFDSVGQFQEFLDDIVHKESVLSGLQPLTDMFRMTTASLTVDFLAGLSVKKSISKSDLRRLNDMGFGVEDLTLIKDKLAVSEDGIIGNTDRSTWGTLDDTITEAVMTTVERTILHPNSATLPKFMTDVNSGQFISRVMFKFMRFPFESYERLLVRGIQEADVKQMLGIAGNIGMWAILGLLKDATREDSKKQFSGNDGMDNLLKYSFIQNSFTALPLIAVDTAWGLTTGKNLTNDYKFNIGGAISKDYNDLIHHRPKLAVPFATFNIGDAVASAFNLLHLGDILNEE